MNGGNHYQIKCVYDNQFFGAIRGVPRDGKNWHDSGTLPAMPAVGYVEIPQVWPGFNHDPEHEYPVGGDIGDHGRVVQRVIQRPTEVAGINRNGADINRNAAGTRGRVAPSNGRRVTGVRGADTEFMEWLETSESEDEWGEE